MTTAPASAPPFRSHAYLPRSGPLSYALEQFPVRIVAVDQIVPGETHGMLTPAQADWLDRTLAAEPVKPTVVALHHPPFATHDLLFDSIGLRDGELLAEVIAKHPPGGAHNLRPPSPRCHRASGARAGDRRAVEFLDLRPGAARGPANRAENRRAARLDAARLDGEGRFRQPFHGLVGAIRRRAENMQIFLRARRNRQAPAHVFSSAPTYSPRPRRHRSTGRIARSGPLL